MSLCIAPYVNSAVDYNAIVASKNIWLTILEIMTKNQAGGHVVNLTKNYQAYTQIVFKTCNHNGSLECIN